MFIQIALWRLGIKTEELTTWFDLAAEFCQKDAEER